MNDAPKVSVIMACYNAGPFIERAIASVVNQTFKDLELIIVDDASSDDSLSLAQNSALKDSRIKVCALNKNVGAATARNIAIEKAKGEWLAILDADDVFLMGKIKTQLNHLYSAGYNNVVLSGTNSFEIDAEGNRIALQKYPISDAGLKRNLIRLRRFPPHSSLMYKTSAVRSLRGFNDRYRRSQDYDLWLRLSRHGSFVLVPEPLVEYRHHELNISKTHSGLEQLKYGIAAVTCYFIRESKQPDPSQSPSANEWGTFLRWVSVRIEEEGLFNYRQTKGQWRNAVQVSENSLFRLVKHSGFMVREPAFAWRMGKEKMFGNYLPQQLSKEWIRDCVPHRRDCL